MQGVAERACVGSVAERIDAGKANAVDRRQARGRPRRQREAVASDAGSVIQNDAGLGPVDGTDRRTKAKVDGILGVEGLRPQRQQIVGRVLEERLGQRRPLIGHVGFGGDQRQLAVITLAAQARGDLRAAMAAADDDNTLLVHCPLIPVVSVVRSSGPSGLITGKQGVRPTIFGASRRDSRSGRSQHLVIAAPRLADANPAWPAAISA